MLKRMDNSIYLFYFMIDISAMNFLWRRWYIELIEALENGHTFINYRQALEKLIKRESQGNYLRR